jgi:hypothetical protein
MKDAPRRGSIVALEDGSAWPTETFANVADRERVEIVSQDHGEPAERFLARLGEQCAAMQAAGVSLGTVVLACSTLAGSGRSRERVARLLLSRLPPDPERRLVLATDAMQGGSANALLGLADRLLRAATGLDLSIEVHAERAFAQAR